MIGAALLALLRKLEVPLLALTVGLLLGLLAYQWFKTANTIDDLKDKAENAESRRAEAVDMLLQGRERARLQLEAQRQRNAEIEANWLKLYEDSERNRKNEIAQIQKSIGVLRVDRDRLYDATRAASVRPGVAEKSPGSEVVCRADGTAQTLGELLIGSDGVSESLAIQAEGLATQVRGLQDELKALEGAH